MTSVAPAETSEPRRIAAWRRVVAVFAAMAFALIALAGPGNVLCFGDDGHIAIERQGALCGDESAGADDSSRAPADASVVAGTPDLSPAAASECADLGADVQLRHDADQRVSPLPRPAATLAFFAASPHVVSAPVETAPRFEVASPPAPPPNLGALRTVVLRV